jgi:hypothetical protein
VRRLTLDNAEAIAELLNASVSSPWACSPLQNLVNYSRNAKVLIKYALCFDVHLDERELTNRRML